MKENFEEGYDYGKWELEQQLLKYAESTNNSRIVEIIYNALYHVLKK